MRKAKDVGVHVDWVEGFARHASKFGTFDKVVSSLVFHQVPVIEKRAGLAAMFAAVRPGGIVCIADYAHQSRWLMRQAFRIVQAADGKADTQPNADGFLELELSRLTEPKLVVDTPTGTISLSHSAREAAAKRILAGSAHVRRTSMHHLVGWRGNPLSAKSYHLFMTHSIYSMTSDLS